MNCKSISIIIPVLNEEKLIVRTVNQFDGKFRKDFNAQLIVSDGGSTDNSVNLIKEKVDILVEHGKNYKQNISEGRNLGFQASSGDVLVFFNADTFIEDTSRFMEKALSVLKNDSTAAIACPVKVFPDEEKLQDKIFHFLYNNYVRFLNYMVMGMGRGECHIMKRELFEKAGGYNEDLGAGEDFDLYKRLRKFGKIRYCRDLTVYESPRRYRKYGYGRVFFDWAKNSIWITLFRKSISKEWEAVR
jgi:glycosyltransferase involved in cell wall biosynthesis